MRFLKTFLSTTSLLGLLILSGCGGVSDDLAQKEKVKPVGPSGGSRFSAQCELNVDEFSKILEENIEPTIKCLGKNLDLFIDLVKSPKPGYLSRVDLENYIRRNRSEIKPEILKAMKAVFDLNFLVYGDQQDLISKQNVKDLITFATLFNVQASENFKPIFKYPGETTYELHKSWRNKQIGPAARIVMDGLKKIFRQNRNGQIHSVNIISLIDAFQTDNNRESLEKIKKVLFIKKVLLGGENEVLTHDELYRLILNFDSLVLVALDAVRFNKITLVQNSMVDFLKQDVDLLSNMIFNRSRNAEKLFEVDEAIEAVKLFIDDSDSEFDPEKYRDLIKDAKTIFMGGGTSNVTGGDFKRLFDHLKTVLDTGVFFHKFWDSKKEILLTNVPIDADSLSDLHLQFPSQKSRIDNFIRIVKNYRFPRGKFESPYYSYDYYRDSNGIYETAIYEYLFNLIFKKYGCPGSIAYDAEGTPVPCDSDSAPEGIFGERLNNESDQAYYTRIQNEHVYLKTEHVIAIVKKFRQALIDLDIIYPGRETKTAETVTLLGSLFQYQSDKNKVFDVNEGAEFATTLLTSIDFSKGFYDFYKTKSSCKWDFKNTRVDPVCFKKYYWEGVCRAYPNQFPKLYEALKATVWEKDPATGVRKLVCKVPETDANQAFLERGIRAARTCNFYPSGDKSEIYYSKSDMMSIFLAIMHIETTILRWDMNLNNVMDFKEVMEAYDIYSPALDGFLEDKSPLIKKFKKQIYQFLVKYEEVPNEKDRKSITKFLKFIISGKKKEAPATRKTIASILVAISEQGAPNLFDCNYMRNPDEIPPDYDPENQSRVDSSDISANYDYLLKDYLYLTEEAVN